MEPKTLAEQLRLILAALTLLRIRTPGAGAVFQHYARANDNKAQYYSSTKRQERRDLSIIATADRLRRSNEVPRGIPTPVGKNIEGVAVNAASNLDIVERRVPTNRRLSHGASHGRIHQSLVLKHGLEDSTGAERDIVEEIDDHFSRGFEFVAELKQGYDS